MGVDHGRAHIFVPQDQKALEEHSAPYSVVPLAGVLKIIFYRERLFRYHSLVPGQACKRHAFARRVFGLIFVAIGMKLIKTEKPTS